MSGERWLWMGEQEDPEMAVWVARGVVRVYDGTRPPTDAERRLMAERTPLQPRPGGSLTLTGGGPCVCGRCLLESACPEAKP